MEDSLGSFTVSGVHNVINRVAPLGVGVGASLLYCTIAEPEKVWQHCSNAAWKVNDLGGKLRAKGPHLSIYVSILFQIDLFRSWKYKFILKFTM